MSLLERDTVMVSTDEEGNAVVDLPHTRANNVEGLGRSFNTYYSVGNVVYVDSNLSVALKCITAGTTSNAELNISAANIGDVITDGTVVWQVCNRISDVTSVNGKTGDVVVGLPVGHIYWSVEPNVPTGRLPAFGATYNRSLYADLWAWANERGLVKSESEWQAIASANDGNCAYYSSGDGSTTFRVPSIKCWVKGASSVNEVGSYLEAGLPNATGSVGLIGSASSGFYSIENEGALSSANANGISRQFDYQNNAGSDIKDTIKFNAHDSNPIFGNSDTVQPPSLVGQWLIVAFGVAQNVGNADVTNVMQAVEQVQTGLGIVEDKVNNIKPFMPDYSAGITLSASSFPYTAPSDGMLHFNAYVGSGATSGRTFTVDGKVIAWIGGNENMQVATLVPKGKVATYIKDAVTFRQAYFYPLKASV